MNRHYFHYLVLVLVVGLLLGDISGSIAQQRVRAPHNGPLEDRWGPLYPIKMVKEYDDAGRLTERKVYALLVATHHSYDSTGHLKFKSRRPLVMTPTTRKDISYYPNGKRQHVTNHFPHTSIRRFWYESGQLKSVFRKGLWGNISKNWENGKMTRIRYSNKELKNGHYH